MQNRISVVIPCFNEINTIEQVINAVRQAKPEEKEIVVVDDGSTDGTGEFLDVNKDRLGIRLFIHKKNKGKGAALQTGYREVTGDIVIVQDADLEYNPNEYIKLIAPIVDGVADVVYGSRFISGVPHRVLYFWHFLGNRFLTLLSNVFTNLNLTDMETCYKVFRREILEKITLKEKRFGVEPEVTAKLSKLNCRIYEVGIAYYGRTYDEGKKIGWKDGVWAIWCIIRYNLF
jgi:glycosyltransferase involved in cell wall biosynthesis